MKLGVNINRNLRGLSAVIFLKLYLLIIVFLYCGTAFANDMLVPAEVCQRISQAVLSGSYKDAEEIADRFIREYPREPAGPLFKASILQYESIDYEDYSRDDEFYKLLDDTERLAREILASDSGNLWANYYLYAASGLRGARATLSGRFLYGIIKGRSGAKGMFRIIDENPAFCDAYLMAGSYRFWKSVKTAPFSWLPLISDERDKCISEVKRAMSCGILTVPLSNTVLLEMLLKYDPDRAVTLAEKIVALYPSCRLFVWQLGEAYKRKARFEDAVRVFSKIAESMRKDEADDGSGELRCWWKLAVLSISVGKKEECIYYCKKIISLGERESVFRRQHERIDKARRMIEEFESE